MNGRDIRLGIEWILLNIIGALVGMLVGYSIAEVIAVQTLFVIGTFSSFLAVLTDGIIIALVVGIVQKVFLRRYFYYERLPRWWLRLTLPGWGLASLSMMPMTTILTLLAQDFSPLIWLVIRDACIAGVLQWLFTCRELPHATRFILSGSLATIIGGCLGVALIGRSEPFIPFLSLLLHQETIHEVNVGNLMTFDSQIFFTVTIEKGYNQRGHRWEFWRSDGTAAHTGPIEAGYFSSGDRVGVQTRVIPDRIFLYGDARAEPSSDSRRSTVWQSDGTSAGTSPITIPTADRSLTAHVLTVTADMFFFQTKHDEICEIWRSDGTVAGTTCTDLPCTNQMVGLDGTLFLLTRENEVLFNLWQSDSTGTDMRLIHQVP